MSKRPRSRSRRPQRKLGRRILVVTEGTLTEPRYVEGLNQYLRNGGATTVVKTAGIGKDPLTVVETCIDRKEKEEKKGEEYAYDSCLVLVDVDEHETLDQAIQRAHEGGVMLLISNLKFEVWLRWHKEDKRSALNSRELDQRVKDLGLVQGEKGKALSRNFPFDKVDDACKTARAADRGMEQGRKGPNPSSAVPLLVDLMRKE